MRISDWSSDVCSSDLLRLSRAARNGGNHRQPPECRYPRQPQLGTFRHLQGDELRGQDSAAPWCFRLLVDQRRLDHDGRLLPGCGGRYDAGSAADRMGEAGRPDRGRGAAEGALQHGSEAYCRGGVLGSAPYLCDRSEEHTSELQSLMRISYAVFCLKKKKTKSINIQHKTC